MQNIYYRFEQDFIHKSSDISSAHGYNYIMRKGKFKNQDKEEGRFIFGASENLPEWAIDNPKNFWTAADAYTDARGDVCYRQIISLPRGMTDEQYIELARSLSEELSSVEKNLRTPCSWAVHEHTASDGEPNVHLHRIFSRCCNDGIPRPKPQFFAHAARKHPERGGAPKSRSVRTKSWLLESRKKTEEMINQQLQSLGRDERVSCLRYEDQPGDHAAEIARRRERWSREEWERQQKLIRETEELKELHDENQHKLELLLIEEEAAAADRDRMKQQLKEESKQIEEWETENRRLLASRLAKPQISNKPLLTPHY